MSAGIDDLMKRGKGSYFCPHGLNCDKGGMTTEGHIREFYRSSEFRYDYQRLRLMSCTHKQS